MVKTGILWRDSTPEQLQADQWEIPPFHTIPVPGEAMREASSVGDAHIWYAIGDCWAQIVSHHLPWGSSQVLDIGCSCGKVARFLAYDPRVSFLGLDVFAPSIEWCRRAFANVPRFRFEHLDVHSLLYNPDGQIAGADVRLPVDDRSVDVVIAGSLFTHLLEDAFKNYLSEIARVLKPSGCGIISIHLRANNPAGFMGDEVQAEVTPDHFTHMADDARLRAEKWGPVFGQTIMVLRPA